MAEIHASLPAKERSEVYVGKYIIVGLTYLDADGTFLRVDQRHGVIVMVETAGIGIALKGDHDGETLSVPLDLRAITDADPGEYVLASTNEVVVDPDLISTWTLMKAA